MLLVEAILFVEFFHLPIYDLIDDVVGLSCLFRLVPVNIALAVKNLLRHFFAAQKPWIERGNMHRHVVAKALKILRARHEIAFAIHFHQHADLSPRMNIRADKPFGRGALCFLRRRRLSLLAKNVDGLLHVSLRFNQGFAACGEARARAVAQLFYLLRVRFSVCCHVCAQFLFYMDSAWPLDGRKARFNSGFLVSVRQTNDRTYRGTESSPFASGVIASSGVISAGSPSTKSPSCFS